MFSRCHAWDFVCVLLCLGRGVRFWARVCERCIGWAGGRWYWHAFWEDDSGLYLYSYYVKI